MFAFRAIRTDRGQISPVHFLILLTLARSKKGTHGYDILRLMKGGFRGGWTPKSGTLYPALDRLVDNGLIAKHEIQPSETSSSPKERTFRYTITDEGKELVQDILTRIPDPFRGISPFWIYVTRHAPPTFHKRFKDSMDKRHGLWGRLWAKCILAGECGEHSPQNEAEELKWLESYKQQLQEELEQIDQKLKKIRSKP